MATCRIDVLAATSAFLRGAETTDETRCPDPADHTAIVLRIGEDWEIEIRVDVCGRHDKFASLADGYVRSIKLRQHAT